MYHLAPPSLMRNLTVSPEPARPQAGSLASRTPRLRRPVLRRAGKPASRSVAEYVQSQPQSC